MWCLKLTTYLGTGPTVRRTTAPRGSLTHLNYPLFLILLFLLGWTSHQSLSEPSHLHAPTFTHQPVTLLGSPRHEPRAECRLQESPVVTYQELHNRNPWLGQSLEPLLTEAHWRVSETVTGAGLVKHVALCCSHGSSATMTWIHEQQRRPTMCTCTPLSVLRRPALLFASQITKNKTAFAFLAQNDVWLNELLK